MTKDELLKQMWHFLNVTEHHMTEKIKQALVQANYNLDLAIDIAMKDGPLNIFSGCSGPGYSKVECSLSKNGYFRGWYPETKFTGNKPDIVMNTKQVFAFVRDNGIQASQLDLFGEKND